VVKKKSALVLGQSSLAHVQANIGTTIDDCFHWPCLYGDPMTGTATFFASLHESGIAVRPEGPSVEKESTRISCKCYGQIRSYVAGVFTSHALVNLFGLGQILWRQANA